jgi:hypothetical protein
MADLASALRSSAPSLDELSAAGGMTDVNGNTTYQYKDASGGIVTVDSTGKSVGYTPDASWYQDQYAAHPDAIRSGMNNEQYLALGPLDQTYNVNGTNVPITGAYEYQIDPKTGALSNTPVDRKQSSNFTDWATTPAGALTLGAMVMGGAYGASALAGSGGAAGGTYGSMGGVNGLSGSMGTGLTTGAGATGMTAGATGAAGGMTVPLSSIQTAAGLGLGATGATGLSTMQKALLAKQALSSFGGATQNAQNTGGGGGSSGGYNYTSMPYLANPQQNNTFMKTGLDVSGTGTTTAGMPVQLDTTRHNILMANLLRG